MSPKIAKISAKSADPIKFFISYGFLLFTKLPI